MVGGVEKDERRSAAQMADAIAYLCRVAHREGLACVLPELISVHEKLGFLAEGKHPLSREARKH
jgi:hypothetical protein